MKTSLAFLGLLVCLQLLPALLLAQHKINTYTYDQRLRAKVFGPGIEFNGTPEAGFDIDLGSANIDLSNGDFPFLHDSATKPLNLSNKQLDEIRILRKDFEERALNHIKEAFKSVGERLKNSERKEIETAIKKVFSKNERLALGIVKPEQVEVFEQHRFRKAFVKSPYKALASSDISNDLGITKPQLVKVQKIETEFDEKIENLKKEKTSAIAKKRKSSKSKVLKFLTPDQVTKLEEMLGQSIRK